MALIELIFPIVFPILAAFAVYPLRRESRALRDLWVRVVPFAVLVCAVLGIFFPEKLMFPGVCGIGLSFASGSLHSLLTVTAAFLWSMTALTCQEYFEKMEHTNRFYVFYLLSLGAVIGIFLAGDLGTLFVFFEVMSFTSWTWVVWPESDKALKAGRTYLSVAVFGGMVLLIGLLLIFHLLGTLDFSGLSAAVAVLDGSGRRKVLLAAFCCLTGFGAKAGAFPLHIWLPKAHPVAPAPASALLSGILTKTGIFGVLIIARYLTPWSAAWNGTVLAIGTITMVWGAVLALFSVDLKRTLACSSMSQIGFILIGVAMQGYLGVHNTAAAWGAVLHMLNHSLIKLVLFICAGVVYLGCRHKLNFNDVRGFGKGHPWLGGAFLIAAASIAGVPGFSGYVSKTLLHESIVEYLHILAASGAPTGIFRVVEWLFLLSGGLTLAYMLRLFVCLFLDPRPAGAPPVLREYMSPATRIAMSASTAVLAVLGIFPGLVMEPIAQWAGEFLRAGAGAHVHYFVWGNLKGFLLSLLFGVGIYVLFAGKFLRRGAGEHVFYPDLWPEKLDLETLVYLPVIRWMCTVGMFFARAAAGVGTSIVSIGEKLLFSRGEVHS